MIHHVQTEGATAGGYSLTCTCGWESLYNQTIKARRTAKLQHELDVENEKIWYLTLDGLLVTAPFSTKKQAMRFAGVVRTTKIAPGRYAIAGGREITTDPRVVHDSTLVETGS